MSYNPIKKSSGVELPSGTYQFFLVGVEPGTRKKSLWHGPEGKKVATKTDEDEEIINWKFETTHPTLGVAQARIQTRPGNGVTGGLVKTLNALAPGELTEEIRKEPDLLWPFCQSLLNRPYFLSIIGKEGFNSIKGIMPVPVNMGHGMPALDPMPAKAPMQQPLAPVQAPPPTTGLPDSFDLDDIPF